MEKAKELTSATPRKKENRNEREKGKSLVDRGWQEYPPPSKGRLLKYRQPRLGGGEVQKCKPREIAQEEVKKKKLLIGRVKKQRIE